MAFLREPASDLRESNRLQNALCSSPTSQGPRKLASLGSYRNLSTIGHACQNQTCVEIKSVAPENGIAQSNRP